MKAFSLGYEDTLYPDRTTIVETANGKAYSWYLERKKGGMESVSWGGAHHFLLLKVILYERLTLCLVCCFNITYY